MKEKNDHFNIIPKERYSVTELNTEIAKLLDKSFSFIHVEGEISNLARPSSGHLYFSLKDKDSQVRCALFRNAFRNLKSTEINNGSKVILKAKVSVFAPRGDYQLIIYDLFESGLGQLQREFLELKNKLAKQGLFDLNSKKSFKLINNTVAIITSNTGAAVRDVISTLKRRWPLINIILVPTLVQGANAALSIKEAIVQVNNYNTVNKNIDCIILARGGGSIEDLWSFNEEIVALAIYESKLPIVSGVGHETDFTISDFVADHRAATPTAAAEFISPNKQEYLKLLMQYRFKLNKDINNRIYNDYNFFKNIIHRLNIQNPINKLNNQSQQLDFQSKKLVRAFEKNLTILTNKLLEQTYALKLLNPKNKLYNNKLILNKFYNDICQSIQKIITKKQHSLNLASQNLDQISPLKILSLGYSITKDLKNNNIKTINKLSIGDKVKVLLSDGEFISTIKEIDNNR